MGLQGQLTGIDLLGEQRGGICRNAAWKEARPEARELVGDTISLGIGQVTASFTLLQLAHAVATLTGVALQPTRTS